MIGIKGMQRLQFLPKFAEFLGVAEGFTADDDIKIFANAGFLQLECQPGGVSIGGQPAGVAIGF